ncbi:MAG: creatininase family protein [Fusobacteriaceae bacterium]
MELLYMNSDDAEKNFKKNSIGILVIGSIEQHGAHAPLGTDFIIPNFLANEIKKREDVILLPGIPYGVCTSIKEFPGTIDIGYDVLLNLLRSIIKSVSYFGMKKIIFINGHGGNISVLDRVALEFYSHGGIIATLDWWLIAKEINPKYGGGHGDIQETSAVMAIAPESVNLDLCKPPIVKQLSKNLSNKYISNYTFKNGTVKIQKTFIDVAPNGWIGPLDPKNSSEKLGKEMMNEMTAYINSFIDEFKTIVR